MKNTKIPNKNQEKTMPAKKTSTEEQTFKGPKKEKKKETKTMVRGDICICVCIYVYIYLYVHVSQGGGAIRIT